MTALGPTMVRQPASDAGSWLIVAECFGVETPTFQGEGPSCGHPALFIRLSRCNLTCARCDTKYTWDWSRFDEKPLPAGEPAVPDKQTDDYCCPRCGHDNRLSAAHLRVATK